MARLTRAAWILCGISAPPVVAAVGWLSVLALSAITGHHPIWSIEPRNLSEAAAFRDGGDVVRRVQQGESLNRAGEVRAGIVSEHGATMMPIEAAAAARDRDIVQLLFDLGTSPDAATWQRAWCASTEPDVRELLTAHRPSRAVDTCGDRP